MHAIIPVAGFGTRLRPHTYTLPKVLLNVAGKPILGHVLDHLISDGVTSATIVVGYLGDMIEEYVRGTYPTLKVNFVPQPELLGLGHSIWVARENIPTNGDPLFIILGDTIVGADLKKLFKSESSALCVKAVEDPRRFGVAEVEDGVITNLVEKPDHPKTNLAVVGLYFFKKPALLRECLDEMVAKNKRTKNEYQLTDALQMMIERGEKFVTFSVDGWYDCGKPETLLETNRELLKRRGQSRKIPGVIINEPVFIADDAHLSNSVVGPYATIASGARIDNAIVRNSIIGDNATVHGVILDESLVGNSAVVKGDFRHVNVGDSSEVDFQ